ncbi:MAG: hypothetical protein A2931_01850 [Candidatus Niyogibacteria bacterium RIFCSPLOWO2_01_FULL_45_48]|uniref:Transcriptional repressor PaaX-like central Cas2-like domain-containing protein n=2 Tax=Candidatus Niyogiibacteriota TaxID=1817912 RepID=A0A1G2EZG6_9BACT|nr:MAG: hypothetical protein A2931_01850 [Candidatus Niyogibacteria bacterium RIFCSPLOWO2_01_FULL_45_48]OGZ31189.1 MAG: hypothetical protein A3J00_01415 [Candidatus Niyogibacteria bacterium RIFCSPLOWO2_02_FULL_45_13]
MITTKEIIENFLNSNRPSATAAKVILAALALGGILVVGAVAPNVLSLFGRLGRNRFSGNQIRDGFNNLKRKKLVEVIRTKGDKTVIRLTTKGGKRIRELVLDTLTIPKPKKWDGVWRVMIFDIPVSMNKARSAFRATIKDLGMYQLQKSVWVYPYPCEDEILFTANFFNIEKHIEIFETKYFMNKITEEVLLKEFNL